MAESDGLLGLGTLLLEKEMVMGKVMAKAEYARQTQHYKKKFLEGYLETGTISGGANKAGVNRSTVYRWLESNGAFAAEFEQVQQAVGDKLEAEAIRRAHDGVLEPVFYKGEECGLINRYSDTLLIFLLKGLRPERYRERHEVTGEGGGPITFKVVYDNERANNTPTQP